MAILYGSQTGNAQAIAERLLEEATSRGIAATLNPLNKWKSLSPPLNSEGVPAVVICSTTGNGDPPENCDRFWRFVKKRTQPTDLMAGLTYTTLALGDTNYDKFCYMGKSVHTRLKELGGSVFYEIACADEGTGTMEDTIEPWLEGLWDALARVWVGGGGNSKSSGSSPAATSASLPPPSLKGMESLSLSNSSKQPPSAGGAALLKLPSGLEPIDSFMTDELKDRLVNLPPGEVPRVRSTMRVSISPVPDPALDAEEQPVLQLRRRSSSLAEGQYTAEHPFMAEVVDVQYLTAGGKNAERRVIRVDLCLSGSGIAYEPGDAVGIRCPNRASAVAFMLAILPSNQDPDSPLEISGSNAIPSPCSLREVLTSVVDLHATPRKPAIRALAEHCTDPAEKQMLLLLSSRTAGSVLYTNFVVEQCLTVPELLALFPSCRPPVEVLLGVLSPLPPRYYSCASSCLESGTSLSIAFGAHSFDALKAARRGLCTEWLEQRKQGDQIPLFLRPTKEFFLPGSTKPPCILIGPGTGVAPFIGFLQHRQCVLRQRAHAQAAASCGVWRGGFEVEVGSSEAVGAMDAWWEDEGQGPLWLFFGNRYASEDWIYRREMEGYLESKVLSRLFTAFSRDGPEKVYVTHRMREVGAELARLIVDEGAYVYVCGDGNAMARDVHATLVEILASHGKDGKGEWAAEEELSNMKKRRRYVMDVWS